MVSFSPFTNSLGVHLSFFARRNSLLFLKTTWNLMLPATNAFTFAKAMASRWAILHIYRLVQLPDSALGGPLGLRLYMNFFEWLIKYQEKTFLIYQISIHKKNTYLPVGLNLCYSLRHIRHLKRKEKKRMVIKMVFNVKQQIISKWQVLTL